MDSFDISLQGSGKAAHTREIYLDAAARFGGHLLDRRPAATWYDVKRQDVELWIGWLKEQGYSSSYVNQLYRSVQQFFRWFCEEEEVPSPFAKLVPPPPNPEEKLVPIIEPADMARLIKDAEKAKDFRNRRDAALLRLFASSGSRLAEIAKLDVDDVDLAKREAKVIGKGRRERTVKFDQKTAQALDRYKRMRVKSKFAGRPEFWLGRDGPLATKSIYRMITRRGDAIGVKIHPHMFRHTFSHNWLDKGGAEGDLMELNGWDSPAMLARYGRSARGSRARRAYDRIDVMDGV